MSQQQIIQLIIIALVAGSSTLGWVFRKLKEHADKRAREQAGERRKLESLRTGREMSEESASMGSMSGPSPIQISQQSSQQTNPQASEIAERRKRQLEELRKRQLARTQRNDEGGGGSVILPPQQTTSRSAPRPMPTSIPGSTGTTVPTQQQSRGGRQQRQRDRGGQRGPAPTAPPQQQQRPQNRQQQRAPQPQRDIPQRSDVPNRAAALQRGEEGAQHMGAGLNPANASIESVMAEMDARRGQRNAALGGQPITPEDWRRAIVMNEILSTPMSLREPE